MAGGDPARLGVARPPGALARHPPVGNSRPAARRLAEDQRPRRFGHRGNGPHDHGAGVAHVAGRHQGDRPQPPHGRMAVVELLSHARAAAPVQDVLLAHLGGRERGALPGPYRGRGRGSHVPLRPRRGRADRDAHGLSHLPDRREHPRPERGAPGRPLRSDQHPARAHLPTRERPQPPRASIRPARDPAFRPRGRRRNDAGLHPRRSHDRARRGVQVRAPGPRPAFRARVSDGGFEERQRGARQGDGLVEESPSRGGHGLDPGGGLCRLAFPVPRLEADPDRHRRPAAGALFGLGGADRLSDLAPDVSRGYPAARDGLAGVSPGARRAGSPLEGRAPDPYARLDPAHDRARERHAEKPTRPLHPGRAAFPPSRRRAGDRAGHGVGEGEDSLPGAGGAGAGPRVVRAGALGASRCGGPRLAASRASRDATRAGAPGFAPSRAEVDQPEHRDEGAHGGRALRTGVHPRGAHDGDLAVFRDPVPVRPASLPPRVLGRPRIPRRVGRNLATLRSRAGEISGGERVLPLATGARERGLGIRRQERLRSSHRGAPLAAGDQHPRAEGQHFRRSDAEAHPGESCRAVVPGPLQAFRHRKGLRSRGRVGAPRAQGRGQAHGTALARGPRDRALAQGPAGFGRGSNRDRDRGRARELYLPHVPRGDPHEDVAVLGCARGVPDRVRAFRRGSADPCQHRPGAGPARSLRGSGPGALAHTRRPPGSRARLEGRRHSATEPFEPPRRGARLLA